MTGEYQGAWWVEVFESRRFEGTRTLDVLSFATEKEQQDYITAYNMESIMPFADMGTPDVYTMAHEAGSWTVREHMARMGL